MPLRQPSLFKFTKEATLQVCNKNQKNAHFYINTLIKF